MASRGRKSAASLDPTLVVIDVQRQRLKPPAHLKPQEKAIFEDVVNTCAPEHFRSADLPVLGLFCAAVHLARFYAAGIGSEADHGHFHKSWIENAKLATSLAVKLRLAPSCRHDARAAQRNTADGSGSYYDQIRKKPWEGADG